jgi:3-deoxy-manno-octulosonate cytidylyltransferase (CMP-KDO synthetase)
MSVCAVIPARLDSKRLPRKVLAELDEKPMLWHVWSRVSLAYQVDRVIIATDSEEVLRVVSGWGGEAMLTSSECQSGSERVASLVSQLEAEFILNVQGDEPLIDPDLLNGLISQWKAMPVDILTPIYPLHELQSLWDPNVVKVARAHNGRALYFSRHPIPYVRDLPIERWLEAGPFWGHIGVYGFRREVLEAYPLLPVSQLETREKLEQLRFIESGYDIYTFETTYRPVSVDTPGDLERVRQILAGGT